MHALQKSEMPARDAGISGEQDHASFALNISPVQAARNALVAWAWTFSVLGLDFHDRLVIAALAAFADARGRAVRSVRSIVESTSLSRSRVELALRRLRGHVTARAIEPGGILPNGSRCVHGAMLYELRPVLESSARINPDGNLLRAFTRGLGVGARARAVLAMLLLHVDRKDRAWPSAARLAELGGMARRSVHMGLGELERAGILRTIRIVPGGKYPGPGAVAPLGGAVRILRMGPPTSPPSPAAQGEQRPPLAGCSGPPCPVQAPPSPVAHELSFELSSEQRDSAAHRVVRHWCAAMSLRFKSAGWKATVLERLAEGVSEAELCATIDAAKRGRGERGRWLTTDASRMTFGNVLGSLDRVLMLGAVDRTDRKAEAPPSAPKAPIAPAPRVDPSMFGNVAASLRKCRRPAS